MQSWKYKASLVKQIGYTGLFWDCPLIVEQSQDKYLFMNP